MSTCSRRRRRSAAAAAALLLSGISANICNTLANERRPTAVHTHTHPAMHRTSRVYTCHYARILLTYVLRLHMQLVATFESFPSTTFPYILGYFVASLFIF